MYVLLVGDLTSGFTVYGPLESEDDAAAWAEMLQADTWWIAPLVPVPGPLRPRTPPKPRLHVLRS